MDHAISNALKRRKELMEQVAKIDLFLEMHKKFSEPMSAAVSRNFRQRGRPADFAGIMEGVLKDVRRPLQRADLVREVEMRGTQIPSDDKPRYLGTILWRHRSKFVNIPGEGYYLADGRSL